MKKNLIIITTRFPYPVIGGDRLRIYQISKELSNFFNLTLISLCESKSEISYIIPEDHIYNKIIRIHMPKWKSWFNSFFALFSSTPLQIAYYKNKDFIDAINSNLFINDAVFAHLIRSGHFIKDANIIKFLDMTDAISLNYKRVQSSKLNFFDYRKLIYSIEYKRLFKYEKDIIHSFNHSFLVSEIDKSFLFSSEVKSLNLTTITMGVDQAKFKFKKRNNNGDIAFIGNMKTLQNLDAVNFLVYEILPKVLSINPFIKVKLIGRISEYHRTLFSKIQGVIVLNEVADVSVAVDGCSIGICPVRLGAGIQTKVLEYMSLGLPCVTTSIGLEGLNAIPNQHVLVSDGVTNIADSILTLYNNLTLYNTISINARTYVEEYHSWPKVISPIVTIINESFN